MRKSRFGLPSLEFSLMLVLIGIVSLVLAERLFYYREFAEKTNFELEVANMRSGLRLEQARRIIANQKMTGLAGKNPVLFLPIPPASYLGEINDIQQAANAGWFFIASQGTLYYKPFMHRHLQMSAPAIALRITGQTDVDLQIATNYQWF